MIPLLEAPLYCAAGAAIGSFLTTAALRSTRGESAWLGRSHCDGCTRPLGFAETLPLISFATAGGRCSSCRSRIDRAHPLGELAGAAAGLAIGLAASGPTVIPISVMGAALLATSVIDARTQRLPDWLTMVVAVCSAWLATARGADGLVAGAFAAAAASLILVLLRQGFMRRRGEPGLGLGDVKLIAALALWLGVWTPLMVALAALMGLASLRFARPKDGRISFGPMIAFAGWSLGVAMETNLWLR